MSNDKAGTPKAPRIITAAERDAAYKNWCASSSAENWFYYYECRGAEAKTIMYCCARVRQALAKLGYKVYP